MSRVTPRAAIPCWLAKSVPVAALLGATAGRSSTGLDPWGAAAVGTVAWARTATPGEGWLAAARVTTWPVCRAVSSAVELLLAAVTRVGAIPASTQIAATKRSLPFMLREDTPRPG